MEIRKFSTEEAEEFLAEMGIQHYQYTSTEDFNKLNKEVYEAIPSSERDKYDANEIIAAAQFFPIYFGDTDNHDNGGNDNKIETQKNQVDSKKKGFKQSELVAEASTISEEAKQKMQQIIKDGMPDRVRRTQSTGIDKVIVKTPLPSTYLKGLQVIPELSEEKLKYYEDHLKNTPENKANFAKVAAAIKDKTKMDVYYDDAKIPVAGVLVTTLSESGKETKVNKKLSKKSMIGFLTSSVAGKIASSNSTLKMGAQLQQIAPAQSAERKKQVGSNLADKAIAKVKYVGVKDALKNPSYVLVLGKAVPDEYLANKALPINVSFVIVETPKGEDGEELVAKERTIRVKGKWDKFPMFRIENPEDVEEFGDIKNPGYISNSFTDSELEAAAKNDIELITAYIDGKLEVSLTDEQKAMVEKLKAFNQAINKESVGSFED